MHLKYQHGMTADDYRVRFGMPFTCALEAPDLVQYRSRLQQERAAQDPAYVERRAQRLALARVAKAARAGHARRCPTEPDPLARLDEALLLSVGKAEPMRQLREKLADGAAQRAQAHKERQEREREYRARYNTTRARQQPHDALVSGNRNLDAQASRLVRAGGPGSQHEGSGPPSG